MATQAAIRRRVKDFLYSQEPPGRPFASLVNDASVLAADTTIVVDDGTFFAAGDIIEFENDGEQVYVLSVSTNTLTVIRGWNDTTAADQADDSVILKNPKFSLRQIDEAIDGVLFELEEYGVHAWGDSTITRVSQQSLYDTAVTDMVRTVGVVSVFHEDSVSIEPHPLPFRFHLYAVTLAAQGSAITILDWGDQQIGEDVNFVYAKQIDAVADLLPRQEELVVLGTVARLLGGTIIPRTIDPGKLTDQSVQPGQGGRDARWFQSEFYLKVHRESAVLKEETKQFPQNRLTARARRWVW